MMSNFVITFREVLEIALVLGAIIGYLEKTAQSHFKKVVYGGVGAGLVASVAGALLFQSIKGLFQGTAQVVFVGATLIFGAIFIVGMLWWQWRQQRRALSITERVAVWVTREEKVGLFLFVLLSVFRDSMEVVVFLTATSPRFDVWTVGGMVGGAGIAVLCGWLITAGIRRLPVKNIFRFTTIFLLLLAASLLIQGLHELGEVGVLGKW